MTDPSQAVSSSSKRRRLKRSATPYPVALPEAQEADRKVITQAGTDRQANKTEMRNNNMRGTQSARRCTIPTAVVMCSTYKKIDTHALIRTDRRDRQIRESVKHARLQSARRCAHHFVFTYKTQTLRRYRLTGRQKRNQNEHHARAYTKRKQVRAIYLLNTCLLYTSDAADE